MPTTILLALLGLWLLGVISGYTAGGLIHILPVIALLALLIRFVQRRKLV